MTHPEKLEDDYRPLVSNAIADVMADLFREALDDKGGYPHGVSNKAYKEYAAESKRIAIDAAKKGELTHGHLAHCQVYDCLAARNIDELMPKVRALSVVALRWLEEIYEEQGITDEDTYPDDDEDDDE